MQVSAIPEVSRVGALSGNARAIGRAQVTFLKITIKTFVRNENRSKNPNKLYLVGGSFGLREFAQIRYDVHKLHGTVDPALKEKLKQNNVTLESEYKKLEKSDLDNWENIRGPQLWEDSRAVQKQRREAARLKTE
nr:cytochrome c oxidase assembly protein COX16 homolog, mitochondrial isoform X1 [Anser cygnoides]